MNSILFATDAAFYPPYQGDSAHMCHLIHFLRQRGWTVHVVHYHDPTQRDVDYQGMSERCDSLTVFFPNQADVSARASDRLDDWCPNRFADLVSSTARSVSAHALLVQYVFLSKCLARLDDRRTVKVLDADNIFAGRRELFEAAGIHYDWFSTSSTQEIEGWRRADLLLAVQEDERDLIARATPGRPVVLAPQVREVTVTDSPSNKVMLFVGADNAANRRGLEGFLADALPQIRSVHPDAVLRVVGRVGLPYAGTIGVDVVGVAPDLEIHYRAASIVLNLVTVGTGLKTKTMEALCHGRCLVSTPAGLQGFERYPDIAHLARTSDEFAATVTRLFSDHDLRRATAVAAARFSQQYFAPDIVLPRIETALRAAIQSRSQ